MYFLGFIVPQEQSIVMNKSGFTVIKGKCDKCDELILLFNNKWKKSQKWI